MSNPIVFISYSHDSDDHREQVRALSERLRFDGVETRLDQYLNGAPKEGWPRWILNQLDEASFVLVICTEAYYRRFRGKEEPGKGKGVDWEGKLITQEMYDARSATLKFVPVLFSEDQQPFIPEPLRGMTHYQVALVPHIIMVGRIQMETAYIVTGTLTDEHTVKLDEALPLAQGKVRLSVEPLAPAPKRSHDEVVAEIWARQQARGHQPSTREEIDAYLQAERDSWDD